MGEALNMQTATLHLYKLVTFVTYEEILSKLIRKNQPSLHFVFVFID